MQEQAVKSTKRIKQISVTGLFGMFNHIIPLNMDERITIIHGPNGFGKTIILKLLEEIFSDRNLQAFGQERALLQTIPFQEICIEFDDDSNFWIVKSNQPVSAMTIDSKIEHQSIPTLTFYDDEHSSDEQSFFFYLRPSLGSILIYMSANKQPPSIIEKFVPQLVPIGQGEWRDSVTNDTLSLIDVITRFADLLPIALTLKEEPLWFRNMRDAIPTWLIETQRLSIVQEGSEESRVTELSTTVYAREIVDIIKTKLAESVTISQSLDRTFPGRVITSTLRQQPISESSIRDRLSGLEIKRERLASLGLLDKDDITDLPNTQKLDERTKSVLTVYAEDTEKKLAVFDPIADRIDLLLDIINKRFLYKKMTISKERGFVFTKDSNTYLSTENLSTGEQHELVLFYELLFKIAPGSLVLIDEPEISLHVVWQEQFLKDIQKVILLSNIDVVVATHSPDIIGRYRNLLVELKGPK